MPNLYEISQQYADILEQLSDDDLELTPQIIDKHLALVKDDFNNKSINLVSFIKNIESDIEKIKIEEQRLKKRRHSMQLNIDRFKQYLKENMEKCNIEKINSPIFDIRLQNNPYKVHVLDDDAVPKEFLIIKKEPNKQAIKDYLKEHGNQEWAELIRDKSLRIK